MSQAHFDDAVAKAKGAPLDFTPGVIPPSAGTSPVKSKKTGVNPYAVEEQRESQGFVAPPTETSTSKEKATSSRPTSTVTSSLLKDAAQASGQTPVGLLGLNHAIKYAQGFLLHMGALHRDIIARTNGPLPKGMKEARESLASADYHLGEVNKSKVSDTGFALQDFEEAGKHLAIAHRHLSSIDPEGAGKIVFSHPMGASSLPITAADLPIITKNPTPPTLRGKKPKNIRIEGKQVPAGQVKTAIAKEAVAKETGTPSAGVREDVTKNILDVLKGTKKARKTTTPSGRTGVDVAPAEKLGAAAVDVGRTGDWSGSERVAPMPGDPSSRVKAVLPEESPKQRAVRKSRVKTAKAEGDIIRGKMRKISKSETFSYRDKNKGK